MIEEWVVGLRQQRRGGCPGEAERPSAARTHACMYTIRVVLGADKFLLFKKCFIRRLRLRSMRSLSDVHSGEQQ